jgi:hypothetical protein
VKRVRVLFTLGGIGVLGMIAFGGCGISVTVDLGSDAGGGGGVIGLDGSTPCWQTDKLCSGVCASKTEVTTGCSAPSCEPCNVPNATAECDANAACAIGTCDPGFANCDQGSFTEHATGCEINIQSDIKNCGACGSDCTVNGPNWQCVFGTCCEITCAPGTLNCNACGVDTVCETQISADNCGSCGLKCEFANAAAKCDPNAAAPTGYQCGFDCNPPYENCDSIEVNGCETNKDTDVTNCGACGNICNTTNGTPSCNGGSCAIQCVVVANVLYGDCTGGPADGCETPLNTTQHCGACGNACNPQNTTGPVCTAGGCSYGACNPGFDDCDGILANGCETPLTVNDHCGSCTGVCATPANGTADCSSQTCQKGCNPGYQNCDGNFNNGCESLSTTQNCAACGTGCNPQHATGINCNGQTCGYTGCQAGWGDCNTGGGAAFGCEQTLDTVIHCGGCNVPCGGPHTANPTCPNGSCQFGCHPGWDDCNGSAGCETQLGTIQNCASCGNACTGNKICQGGSCQCPSGKPMNCGATCAANCCDNSDCSSGNKCCVNDVCVNPPGDGGC